MIQKVLKLMQSLVRWFFGAPFRQLPPEFGDAVPPTCRLSRPTPRSRNAIPKGVSNRHFRAVPNKPSLTTNQFVPVDRSNPPVVSEPKWDTSQTRFWWNTRAS